MRFAGPGLAGFAILLWLAGIVLVTWALILWLVVGHRWLRLHPAPPRASAYAPPATAPSPGFAAPLPTVAELAAQYGPELRAWASAAEGPSALAQRLGTSGAAAAQIRDLALRAAAGTATEAEWAQLRPWLPKLLSRD